MKTNIANRIRSNLLLTIDKEIKSNQIPNYFKLNNQTIKESVRIEFNEVFTCKQAFYLNDDIQSSIISLNDTASEFSISNSIISNNDNGTQASSSHFGLLCFSSFDKHDHLKQNISKLKSFCTSLKASKPINLRSKTKRGKMPSKTNKVNANLLKEFKENLLHQHRGSFALPHNRHHHQRFLSQIPFQ